MTRQLWAPQYVNVSAQVLRNKDIPYAAFRFYCFLRAFAWGDESFRLDMDTLIAETGLTRSRIYEYARLLRLHSALLWRYADKAFEYSFPGEIHTIPENGKRDSASSINSLNQQVTPEALEIKNHRGKKSPSRKTENGIQPTAKTPTREIQDAYCELLGYKPDNWAAGEGAAAKQIGMAYTVSEFQEAYRHFKSKPFWAGQRVHLRWLVGQMPEYFKAKTEGRLNGKSEPSNIRLPDGV